MAIRVGKRLVDGLEITGTEYFVWDEDFPGFGVRVSQGGAKSFVVMFGERRQLRTLGRYPILSLKDARKLAMSQMSSPTGNTPRSGLRVTEAVADYTAQAAKTSGRER